MNDPAPEQLARLPKYAQDHIRELQLRAVRAERDLKAWTAKQTKTKVWTLEYTGGEHIERYFQADTIEIEHNGVHLKISGMWDDGPDLQLAWWPAGRGMPLGTISMIPTSTQQVKLTNLAHNEHDLKTLLRLKQLEEKNERQTS